ncbi:MAG: GWxTD domain-containing protein [Calditrichota bacterium]
MKSTLSLLLACALLVITPQVYGELVLDLDHAGFRADDSLGYVEIYTAVHQSGLRYREMGDSLFAEFKLALDILQNETIAITDTFHAFDKREASEQIDGRGNFYAHAFRFIIKPGAYQIRASLFHWEDQPIAVIEDSLTVPDYPPQECRISDIELGTYLQLADTAAEDVFTKNGIRLIPNATCFYGKELPVLYYYTEAYGLDYDSAAVDSHLVTRRVVNAETQMTARADDSKIRRTTGHSVVIADGFPISTLRTGTYYLELQIQSFRTGKTATARKKFWTYRPEDYVAGQSSQTAPEFVARVLSSDLNFLEVIDLDSAQQWMRYILTPDESRRLRRLTPEGRRQFVADFWKQREQNDPGAGNRYFARIVEANRRYSYLKRPGWKTDRGRVFVLYGEPDRTQRNYAMPGIVDHEIWEYNQLEGGVIFVFADRQGFGDLDMVHSTKRGEMYNPDWMQRVRSSDRNTGTTDPSSPGRFYE